MLWSAIAILAVAAVDQVTKALVRSAVPGGASLPVLGGVLHITHVHNTGSAFGVFATTAVPILVSIVLLGAWVGLALMGRALPFGRAFHVGVALVLGGAVGNLVDRLRAGYVLDFIDIRIWPVFNLADAAIATGMAIAVCEIILRKPARRSSQ